MSDFICRNAALSPLATCQQGAEKLDPGKACQRMQGTIRAVGHEELVIKEEGSESRVTWANKYPALAYRA
jgi:hypothetical protein